MSRVSEYQRTASDAVSWHQDQALQTRILLLHPTGPAGFVLMDTEENQRCKVLLGDPHICSCKVYKKEKSCKHIFWVLLKKFKVPRTDPVSFQLGLVDRELQSVLNGFYCKPKTSRAANNHNTDSQLPPSETQANAAGVFIQREITEDDCCPICQEEFLSANSKNTQHEPVTFCKYGCGQNVHIRCMKSWASYQKSTAKENLECPLCRADFGTLRSLMEELHNAQTDLGRNRAKVRQSVHTVACNNCVTSPIEGKCYRCRTCSQFHLCQNCFTTKIHMHHNFEMKQKTTERWKAVDRGFLLHGNSVGPNGMPNSIEQLMMESGLQGREITENDYDLLLRLDEGNSQSAVNSSSNALLPGATLTDNEVSLLPSMTIKKQHVHLLKPGIQCNVCLQAYRIGQAIRRLPCRHKFHQNCIDGHLLHQSDCCPVCCEPIRIEKEPTETEHSVVFGSRGVQKENMSQKLGGKPLKRNGYSKPGVFEYHGNDIQLDRVLTIFGQSDGAGSNSHMSAEWRDSRADFNLTRYQSTSSNSRKQNNKTNLGQGDTFNGIQFDPSMSISTVNFLSRSNSTASAPPITGPKLTQNSKNSRPPRLIAKGAPLKNSNNNFTLQQSEYSELVLGPSSGKLIGTSKSRNENQPTTFGNGLNDNRLNPTSHQRTPGSLRSRTKLPPTGVFTKVKQRSNSLNRLEIGADQVKKLSDEVNSPISGADNLNYPNDDNVDDDAIISNVSHFNLL